MAPTTLKYGEILEIVKVQRTDCSLGLLKRRISHLEVLVIKAILTQSCEHSR